jgi:hypothetical protein
MCTNSVIRDELYCILYNQSLFVVHYQNYKKPTMPVLSERARGYISHLIISFTANETTKTFFDVDSYPRAFTKSIAMTEPLVPNVRYFGVNFWSLHFERLFPTDTKVTMDVHRRFRSARKDDHADFRDTSFLTRTLNDLIHAHPAIESFALLRDMQGQGHLNWNRDKVTVKKALARDVMKCMKKVYNP